MLFSKSNSKNSFIRVKNLHMSKAFELSHYNFVDKMFPYQIQYLTDNKYLVIYICRYLLGS